VILFGDHFGDTAVNIPLLTAPASAELTVDHHRPVQDGDRPVWLDCGYLRGGGKILANTSATRLPPAGARFVDGEVKATTVPPRAIDGSILR
jgi:hypothetical protein